MPQQDDVGGILGNIDCAVDQDPDIGVVQGESVVDTLAQVPDDVASAFQREDDAVLLQRRDAAEQVCLTQPCCQGLITERLDFGERLKEFSAKGDALGRLNTRVDFELFRAGLEQAVPRSDRSKGGRPLAAPV